VSTFVEVDTMVWQILISGKVSSPDAYSAAAEKCGCAVLSVAAAPAPAATAFVLRGIHAPC
jgi:hypothetical protein